MLLMVTAVEGGEGSPGVGLGVGVGVGLGLGFGVGVGVGVGALELTVTATALFSTVPAQTHDCTTTFFFTAAIATEVSILLAAIPKTLTPST
jgi:hypothetical protein